MTFLFFEFGEILFVALDKNCTPAESSQSMRIRQENSIGGTNLETPAIDGTKFFKGYLDQAIFTELAGIIATAPR